MRKFFIIIMILIGLTLYGGGSDSFSLSLKKDITLSVIGVSSFFAGYQIKQMEEIPVNSSSWWDEEYKLPFSGNLDKIGDISSVIGVLTMPLLIDDFNFKSISTIGLMYTEALLLTIGVKDILKGLIRRPRPYAYENNVNNDYNKSPDDFLSFPSGHTSIAFMTTSFTSYVYFNRKSSMESKILFTGLSYGVALSTAILRVASGSHYSMDVLAGAVLGTSIGLLVPLLHKDISSNLSIHASLNQISLVYRI